MNPKLLYAIPVLWVVAGLLYATSVPKEGFAGIGELVITFVGGFALLVGVITYNVTKKVFWSIASVPGAFLLLILIVGLIARILG